LFAVDEVIANFANNQNKYIKWDKICFFNTEIAH